MIDKCRECMLESGHRMDCSAGAAKYTQEQLAAENKLYLEKNLELVRQAGKDKQAIEALQKENGKLGNQLGKEREQWRKHAIDQSGKIHDLRNQLTEARQMDFRNSLIQIESPEDINPKLDELLIWDGCEYHIDHVEFCPDQGVQYMANGTEPVSYMELKEPEEKQDA